MISENSAAELEEQKASNQLRENDQDTLVSLEYCLLEGILPHVDEDGILLELRVRVWVMVHDNVRDSLTFCAFCQLSWTEKVLQDTLKTLVDFSDFPDKQSDRFSSWW